VSDAAAGIRNVLHTKGFSTHSWPPSTFTPPTTASYIDRVLTCTREPLTETVLGMFRRWGRFRADPRANLTVRSVTFGFKHRGAMGGSGVIID
jgi:hypothetical protein